MDKKNNTLVVFMTLFIAIGMIIVGLIFFFKGEKEESKSLSCSIKTSDSYKIVSNTTFDGDEVSSVQLIYTPTSKKSVDEKADLNDTKTLKQIQEYMSYKGTTYTMINDEVQISFEKRAYNLNKNNTSVTNLFLKRDKLIKYY